MENEYQRVSNDPKNFTLITKRKYGCSVMINDKKYGSGWEWREEAEEMDHER